MNILRILVSMCVIRLFVFMLMCSLFTNCFVSKSKISKPELSSNLFAIKIKHLQTLNNIEQIKDDSEVLWSAIWQGKKFNKTIVIALYIVQRGTILSQFKLIFCIMCTCLNGTHSNTVHWSIAILSFALFPFVSVCLTFHECEPTYFKSHFDFLNECVHLMKIIKKKQRKFR